MLKQTIPNYSYDVILSVYSTFSRLHEATGHTCNILNPRACSSCEGCVFYVGDTLKTCATKSPEFKEYIARHFPELCI